MKNISKLIQRVARRAGTLCLLAMAACAQAADKEAVPEFSPKGKVSLEYPNQWDFNDLIALSNDGRYLIDASKSARYIRVWDWEKKEVVRRLLLNEDNPEHNDNKEHKWVLGVWGGAKLAITPDGRMLAACVSISHNWPSQTDNYVTARIWNLESGAIVADIPGVLRNVPGFGEAVLQASCGSISYSPDGKYMAYASGASFFANDAERDAYEAGLKADSANAAATRKYVQTVKIPDRVSGIALYETSGWKLVKFIPLPNPENKQARNKHVTPSLKSTMLFTGNGKQLIGVVFEQPYYGEDKRESNRIVRWDIESGAVLEEKEVPKLAPPSAGVWWHWLPGGREVWWPTYAGTHSRQTQAEMRSCEAASAAPAFVSEVVENCAYNWAIGILGIETGKIKYLAPFRKNPPLPNSMERELSSFSAGISPDGAHLVLLSNMAKPNTIPSVNQVSNIDVLDRGTLRVEGRYSWNGASTSPMFSSDSRYFAVRAFKRGRSAMIFELPKTNIQE
ncbi:MAG: WD40 repeat domain-containing protein [Gallionellaceae bacterium]